MLLPSPHGPAGACISFLLEARAPSSHSDFSGALSSLLWLRRSALTKGRLNAMGMRCRRGVHACGPHVSSPYLIPTWRAHVPAQRCGWGSRAGGAGV